MTATATPGISPKHCSAPRCRRSATASATGSAPRRSPIVRGVTGWDAAAPRCSPISAFGSTLRSGRASTIVPAMVPTIAARRSGPGGWGRGAMPFWKSPSQPSSGARSACLLYTCNRHRDRAKPAHPQLFVPLALAATGQHALCAQRRGPRSLLSLVGRGARPSGAARHRRNRYRRHIGNGDALGYRPLIPLGGL